jgi:hypothetical protein
MIEAAAKDGLTLVLTRPAFRGIGFNTLLDLDAFDLGISIWIWP